MRCEWLGRLAYADALEKQRARRDAVLAGEAPEVIWLLEHDPPVVTVGRRPAPGTPTASFLLSRGTDYARIERGGLATWHGPGQLVAYLIVDAGTRRLGVRRLVAAVESAVIVWLQGEGIVAGLRPGYPGVWVGEDKICALGFHFRRGVSMHGLALNLCPDLASGFGLIVPCGVSDGGVTSLERLTGRRLMPADAWESLGVLLCEKLLDGSVAVS